MSFGRLTQRSVEFTLTSYENFRQDTKMTTTTSSDEFQPDWASPPGDTIRECLEERAITIHTFARKLKEPMGVVVGLLDGTHAITPELAQKLERVFGAGRQFWINRQANYDKAVKRLGRPM